VVIDVKVGNMIKSAVAQRDRPRAAHIAFANTYDEYSVMTRGREAVDTPAGTTKAYNRRNHSGRRPAKPGHYDDASSQGHTVVCALFEVTGARSPETTTLFNKLAREHGNKIPWANKGDSWTDSTYLSHLSQRTSIAIKRQAAKEIRRAVRNRARPCKPKSSTRAAR